MTDNELIKELLDLADKMNIAQRFREADFLEKAAGRLMSLPKQIAMLEHPAQPAPDNRAVVDEVLGKTDSKLRAAMDSVLSEMNNGKADPTKVYPHNHYSGD